MRQLRAKFETTNLRSVVPWVLFGFALVLATEPAWQILLMGFSPTLDDLLSVRCFGVAR